MLPLVEFLPLASQTKGRDFVDGRWVPVRTVAQNTSIRVMMSHSWDFGILPESTDTQYVNGQSRSHERSVGSSIQSRCSSCISHPPTRSLIPELSVASFLPKLFDPSTPYLSVPHTLPIAISVIFTFPRLTVLLIRQSLMKR